MGANTQSVSKREKLLYVIIASVVILIYFAVTLQVINNNKKRNNRLNEYKLFIEEEFKTELAYLESEMQKKEPFEPGEKDDYLGYLKKREMMLSAPEIFCVYGSLDGHHGMRTLKSSRAEGSCIDGYTSGSNYSRNLYYGRTESGTKFLAYIHIGNMTRYRIDFVESTIQSMMNNKNKK